MEPSVFTAVEANPIWAGQAVAQAEEPVGEALVQPAEPGILANRHLVGGSCVLTIEALRVRRLDEQQAG